ncbi:MAG: homoserine dehydrogenase, partial [Verrucomicrobia bacterium]|nr:homoserine dehydrogenase [Verrucomicrobiota bacterium]
IPVIKALREGLIANRIGNIYGILNGTCNYILTRMKREGAEFDDVLADAQRQGFAEADPSLDVDGFDTLHKTGILASLAHGFWINPGQIHCEGIRFISKLDIQFAEQLGYSIKLLGVVKSVQERKGVRRGSGSKIQVYVCPVMVPEAHILASVNEVFNAVFVRGDVVGDTLYYGRGAGQDPTASAVVSDLADAARDLKFKSSNRIPAFVPHEVEGAVVPMDEVVSKYYIRLSVIDKPGVLAKISAVFAEGDIGIASVIQPRSDEGNVVPLIMMTHDAANLPMSNALKKISKLSVVKGEPVMIRIEDLS